VRDRNEWNRKNIEEFRANGGRVGGNFAGTPLLLLTTTGARSGKRYTTPVMYLPDGDRLVIFASKGGAPTSPDWYHNLVAHPHVTVEVGTETREVNAVVARGAERDELYARQAQLYPQFAEYQQKTTRQIPVVILERAD
jgi:deazaflavin-dependent oxidoreductase (nitroreductase family)